MKKLIFLLPIFLISCAINQKITYPVSNIATSQQVETIPISVEMKILVDNRANLKENEVLFTKLRNYKYLCFNSERHYKKETVVSQITQLLLRHFNQAKLFTHTSYNDTIGGDYYLTGTLTSFYGEQGYSVEAAVGAMFGLIGALATANATTPGRIVIEISDLQLFRKDGTLVKDFGDFYKEYKGEFPADKDCWCIYRNMNTMLKDFNTQLIEKLRVDLLNINL
jgi:hypothetical protein